MNFRDTLRVEGKNLFIGDIKAVDLAEKFGTPLYVMDENYIRKMCRAFKSALKDYGDFRVSFSSKAFASTGIYPILKSEGIYADAFSGGEIYTALKGGFPADMICFHGNNKTYRELTEAVENGIRCVDIDNLGDIEVLDEICKKLNKTMNVAIRVNPQIDAHTHHYVQTAKVDSKFGISLSDVVSAAEKILNTKTLKFKGLHCHIGSQIFDSAAYVAAADKLTDLMQSLKTGLNLETEELNLGGGFGAYYSKGDEKLRPEEYSLYINAIIKALEKNIKDKNLNKPCLAIEPGRSIVAEAGITLYTAGSIKEIKGIRKYIGIDGGMFENPRYALYQSKYSAILANRADEKNEETVTLCGKCCESSDMIIVDINLPKVKRGDIIAVFGTGAYNYSMASHYNRNFVPPVVLVNGKDADYLVRSEDYEDIIRNDNIPKWL